MPQNTFKALPFFDIDASSLSGTYQQLNPPGFAEPVVYLRIVNRSNVDLLISYDGVTNNDICMADSTIYFVPPLSSLPNNKAAVFAANTAIWGICANATGHIYIAAYYV